MVIGAAVGGEDDTPRPLVGDSITTLTLPLAETTLPPTTVATTTAATTTQPAPVTTRATVVITAPPTLPVTTAAPSVYYANCTAVRAAGAAPIRRGQPGYGSHLDRDNDGIACET